MVRCCRLAFRAILGVLVALGGVARLVWDNTVAPPPRQRVGGWGAGARVLPFALKLPASKLNGSDMLAKDNTPQCQTQPRVLSTKAPHLIPTPFLTLPE